MRRADMRLALALLAGAGCSGAIPELQPPPLPEQTPGQWLAGATTGPVDPAEAWWQRLGGNPLAELVAECLAHNHDLSAAVARLDAAGVQARLAGAALAPTLSAELDALRQRQVFVGLPIGGQGLATTFSSYGVSLTASWELDVWGRVRAGQSAALGELAATAADLRGTQLSLAAQTARVWFALTEAQLQHDLAVSTVASFTETVARVQARFAQGTRPALDLRLALANLAQAEALREQRQELKERTLRQLELLLGRYPAGKATPGADLPEAAYPVPAGLPAELLRRRPDLVAAERRLAASDRRVAEATAALYPRIALTTTAGAASAELEDLVDSDFFVWNLVGNLSAPIFAGGRLRGEVALQEARLREAAAVYAQSVLRAFTEVETALAAEQALGRRVQQLAAAAEASGAAQRLAEERYEAGLTELVTVLEAQRRALEARVALLSVRRQKLDARIDLHLALGGGLPLPASNPVSGPTR